MDRKYSCKDVVMLSACDIMAETALDNVTKIEKTNSALNAIYYGDLKSRIDAVLKEYFGINSGRELQNVTSSLEAHRLEMLHHLTLIRTQVDAGFEDARRRKEILSDLGFNPWWKKAKRNNSQIALIALLEVFEKGCTDELADELTTHKVPDVSLAFVKDNIGQMYAINVRQEKMKHSRKAITDEAVGQFNSIYKETMSYARGLQITFKNDPILKPAFTFSTIVKQLDPTKSKPSGGSGDNTENDGNE